MRKTSSAKVQISSADGHKKRSLYAVTGKINGLAKLYTGKSSEADKLQAANSQNYPCFVMCTENYVWLWGFSGSAHQTSRNYLHRADAHVKKLWSAWIHFVSLYGIDGWWTTWEQKQNSKGESGVPKCVETHQKHRWNMIFHIWRQCMAAKEIKGRWKIGKISK